MPKPRTNISPKPRLACGRVAVVGDTDGSAAALVEVVCQHEPADRGLGLLRFAANAARLMLHNPDADVAQAAAASADLADLCRQLGQTVRLRRMAALRNPAGRVAFHAIEGGRVGVLLSVDGNVPEDLLTRLCEHVAAHDPPPLEPEGDQAVPPDQDLSSQRLLGDAGGRTFGEVLRSAGGTLRTFVRVEAGRLSGHETETETGEPTMPEITASMVRELRDRTGVAMMDCKNALSEAGGDMEKAVRLLRERGQAKQDKLSSREAREGRVEVASSVDFKKGAIVEINCNTDFTAKSPPVIAVAKTALQLLMENPTGDLASQPDLKAKITEAAQQTGENIQIGRTATLQAAGRVGTYGHYTGKVGVLVALTGNPSDELVRDLCLHITAARPLAMTREELPPDVVARERDIAIEQAKGTGKPQNIAEKIAEGKMRTFYEERVLLDQVFVNAEKYKGTVGDMLKAGGATLEKYVRIEIGQ